VLLAADGLQNVDIAARVGVCVDMASMTPRGSTRSRSSSRSSGAKVVKPADFADLDALADRLRRFEDR